MFSFFIRPKSDQTPSFQRFLTDKRSELVRSFIKKKLLFEVTFLGSFWQKKVVYGKICIKMLCFINFCQKAPSQYFFPVFFREICRLGVSPQEIEKIKTGTQCLGIFRQKSIQPSNNTIRMFPFFIRHKSDQTFSF